MAIDTNNLFGLKQVPEKTRQELDARSTTKIKEWHAVRKPWAHIMSLSENCAGDITTQFGLRVGPGNGAGYMANFERPHPTLESIQVKKQGELGTTRRLLLEIKAYTDDQLNKIAKCYFIPGMSVRVQWGWNIDALGRKSPQPITTYKKNGELSDPMANALIRDAQKQFANYDGLQGRVVHYNTTLDSDNVWNISIEIVGAGTMMTDAKVNNYSDGCSCKVTPEPGPDGQPKEEQDIKTSNLKARFVALIDDPKTNKAVIQSGYRGKSGNIYTVEFEGYDLDDSGAEDKSGFWVSIGLRDGITTQKHPFISFGALQRIISCAAQSIDDNTKEPKDFEISSDGVLLTIPIDEGGNKIMMCSDPRVGYIPGGDLQLSTEAPSAVSNDGIILDNILLNANHCLRLLNTIEEGTDSVTSYLLKVLEDFNFKCGSPWDFDFVNTSDTAPDLKPTNAPIRLTIVDTKKSKKNAGPYVIQATAQSSHVRGLKIDMKLTEAMKTQALYSGGGLAAPDTKVVCNESFAAFTRISGKNTAVKYAPPTAKTNCGTADDKCSDKVVKTSFAEAVKKLKEGATDESVEAVRGELVSKITSNKDANCKGSLIPVNFGVTLDGIGGFSFGQSIDCSRFPKGWNQYFTYQVTVVEHSINHSDWETTLTTVARLI